MYIHVCCPCQDILLGSSFSALMAISCPLAEGICLRDKITLVRRQDNESTQVNEKATSTSSPNLRLLGKVIGAARLKSHHYQKLKTKWEEVRR